MLDTKPFVDVMIAATKTAIAQAVGPLETRIRELEERQLEYLGVYEAEREYSKGHMVTLGGSLWHCNVTGTKQSPKDLTKDWSLIAQRGKDGRDAQR